MAAGQNSIDFVGYTTGKVPEVVVVGMVGFVDFAGYPVGAVFGVVPPAPAPTPGIFSGGNWFGPLLPRKKKKVDKDKIRRKREDEEIVIL